MKSGASDPFGDEEEEEAEPAAGDGTETAEPAVSEPERARADDETKTATEAETATKTATETESGDSVTEQTVSDGGAGSLERSQIPYTLRRNNVKDERPHVHQLFVTDDTDTAARETERGLEEILDTDVYRLDAREAIYRIGMRHPEEVAALLEEWGYNF